MPKKEKINENLAPETEVKEGEEVTLEEPAPEPVVKEREEVTIEDLEKANAEPLDSDFADEVPESPKETTAEEGSNESAEPEKEGVDLYADENDASKTQTEETATEVVKDAKGRDVVQYVYKDERLKGIEEARKTFHAVYKKSNILKWVFAGLGLAIVILGWVIPNVIPGVSSNSALSFGITIGVVAVALVAVLVLNSVIKRKNQRSLDTYFADYYRLNNEYVFGDKVTNIQGAVGNKLDEQLFKDSNIYVNLFKVGSRDCLTFELDGKPIVYSDAAGQVKGKKSLRTVFVGKFVVADNDWEGDDILIYFKGNKRALPPTNLEGRSVYSDKKDIVIYGGSGTKKFLTHAVRETLAKFETNATLVDLTISVRKGKTYVGLGYEDTLMVLPLDKPFNPAPTEQLASDTDKLFAFLRATWGHKPTPKE